MGVVLNARQRVRDAVIAEIVAEARRQLAAEGAAALSLRAVARELGMASSAMYRYIPSREELLTILIVEAYDALGEVAETAAATAADAFQRWKTVCRAIRGWALDSPQEYALLYGSPVPGYQAPPTTIGPASRVTLVLAGLLLDAHRAGELGTPHEAPLSPALAAEAEQAQAALPDLPLPTVARALVVWPQLFGQISFEVFGRFASVVTDAEVLFGYAVTLMAGLLGITAPVTVDGDPEGDLATN